MKKSLITLFLLVPFFIIAKGSEAKFTIKGQAVDSVTKETLPYVTCSVAPEKNPAQVITRFAGDIDGKFSGELKVPGSYILIISCVGQEPAKRSFTVDADNINVQLGKIQLAPSKQSLKELNVVVSRPLIKAEADKITYDAEQDPESKSSTVLDLLRKVPMVTVDGQDNIQLKGSSNFKFFLNGKPTNMFNNNPGMILKSMPSNMVKNVEVITQPGAKYDAEGVGGIINIVTMQQTSAEGYSATFNAQATSRGSYGGGLNLMLQYGKFSFSGNYNYNLGKQFPITTSTERNSFVPGAPYPRGTQEATVTNKTPMQFGSGQLSYELDTANLFTLSFNRRYGRPLSTTDAYTANFDAADDTVFFYTQNSIQRQTWGSTDVGLDYQHSFKKKNELLTLSYRLSNTPNNSNYEATNTIDPEYITQPQSKLFNWTKSENFASSNEHTVQADYSNPVAKGQTLELGMKYILRLNNSETDESYKYFDFDKIYPFTPYIESDSTYSYDNEQNILGSYISYTGNIGKWSLKGGLRYEHTWLKAKFNTDPEQVFPDYGALVPSAVITYRLTDMQNFKLGYNKRIQRPSIGYLNPYVNRSDPNYISYGNPDLQPENNHNVTFGYSSFAPKYNISAELSYSFVNNAIEQYSFIKDGSTVQEITYGNIGHNNQVGMNLFGSYRGLPWLNLYMNGNINYVDMQSTIYDMSNSGFTGRMFLGGTFILPKEIRLSAGGGGNLPRITLQGSQSAFYFSYMALSKDFLKKRLNVSASGVYLPKPHIVITTNGYSGANNTPTFTQLTDVDLSQNLEFRLNVSYRLGDLKAQVKKTKTTISNDDQKAVDNSGVGQSPM